MKRRGKFEIFTGKDGKHYVQLKSPSGHVLFDGRGYPTRAEAIHGIASIVQYGSQKERIITKIDTNNNFGFLYFQVKSPAGRLLGKSRLYEHTEQVERDILLFQQIVQEPLRMEELV